MANADEEREFIPVHSNEWVVKIDGGKAETIDCSLNGIFVRLGDEVADLVANELGLKNQRKVRETRLMIFILRAEDASSFRSSTITIYSFIQRYLHDRNEPRLIGLNYFTSMKKSRGPNNNSHVVELNETWSINEHKKIVSIDPCPFPIPNGTTNGI